jgi:hypothetical protein
MKALTPGIGQILVTVQFNAAIEASLIRMAMQYRRFTKAGVKYLQYCTADRYYHAKKA